MVPDGGWPGRQRGEVIIHERQRPPGRGLPGSGNELEAQPVEEHPKARRLMLSVKVGRQLARLHRMGDPRGEWLLEPLRGTFGRVGQCGDDRRLRQEGQVDQRVLASVGIQGQQFSGRDLEVRQRH